MDRKFEQLGRLDLVVSQEQLDIPAHTLRPRWCNADHETIDANTLENVMLGAVSMPVINCVKHGYTGPDDRLCCNRRRDMQSITAACANAEAKVRGTHLEDICDNVRAETNSSLPSIRA